MSIHTFQIFRLLVAAVNGALFAFGIGLLFELLFLRPRRWQEQLKTLILEAEKEEREQTGKTIVESDKRQSISELQKRLSTWKRDPKTRINIVFGFLVTLLAFASLLALILPGTNVFIR